MRTKALGSRIPNDHWSGLGFSRSSPSHVLKARLEAATGALPTPDPTVCRRSSAFTVGNRDMCEMTLPSNVFNGGHHRMNDDGDPPLDNRIGPWVVEQNMLKMQSRKGVT